MSQGFAIPHDNKLGTLPGSLNTNRRLSQWLRILPDGGVIVYSGKVELGQGILTALAQIVAEELDVDQSAISMVAANTEFSPNELVTSGSLSIQDSGRALRQVCAEIRAIYLNLAAQKLGEPVSALTIEAGIFTGHRGSKTSYAALADDTLLDREATGLTPTKSTSAYSIVGTSTNRLDLPDKVFGNSRFIHDLELPGMVHGRILRPNAVGATLISVDEAAVCANSGVISVVRDGSLLAVLAHSQHHADAAFAKLQINAVWTQSNQPLPDETNLSGWLRSSKAETTTSNAPSTPTAAVSQTITARFSKPFMAHASIAPSCALAQFDGERLKVWTHSQGIYNLRTDLALAFGMSTDDIIIQHVEGAGCYGHNPADDVAFDAAWLARNAHGRPVRVMWSRADELTWAPFSPAMEVELEADIDTNGGIVGWRHSVWSNGHTSRPGRGSSPALLGAWYLAKPFKRLSAINPPLAGGGGAERNAVPGYQFPNWQVVNHRVLDMPLRTSAMRSLGALANVFAVESFMDELAAKANCDPIMFRLRYITDQRACAVINLALEKSSSKPSSTTEGIGRGFGYARYKNTGGYCAVVADIAATNEIHVQRLTIAVDVGLVINPDGVKNQIEGGAIQATSWALKEAVHFDRAKVTSNSWESYPILRFTEVPAIDVHLIPSCEPSLGAGECSIGPTAAAIANAVFNALGVRIRQLPITAERILATI